MMVKRASVVLPILAGLILVIPAKAVLAEEGFFIDARRNNCWPKPFVCPDRQAVRMPFHLMVHNGWERQNLLGEHHFREGATELTEAGKLKVKWILFEAPQHHRTIFVHCAATKEDTKARIDSVEDLTARLLPSGNLPTVVQTRISSPGWPAWQVDAIGRKFESSTPEPRLPAADGGGEAEK